MSRAGLPCIQSLSDDDLETNVSDLVSELARLGNLSCIPRWKNGRVKQDGLPPPQAFVAALVGTNLSIQAILDMSPMREDETLGLLALLVTSGTVTLASEHPH